MHQPTPRRALRRRNVLAAAAALVLLPVSLAACGDDSSGAATGSDGNTTVSVGVIPIIDVAPIYLGVKKGFFDDEGLDLKLETAQGGAAIVPGVMSGQYQFGFSNTVSLILASSQGLKLKAVAAGVATTGQDGMDFGGVVVPADSDIKTAADLAGKKVAVNTLKNINTVTVNAAVRAAGGDPSTIQYVELAFPDIASAVAKGDVDAGQVVEPFLSIAKSQGDRVVSSNYVATDPKLQFAEYFTSDQYAQDHADVVQKFGSAMKKSLDYAQQHPDEARAILTDYTDLDPGLQKQVVLPSWPSTISSDSVTKLADLMVQDGLVDSAPDTGSLTAP